MRKNQNQFFFGFGSQKMSVLVHTFCKKPKTKTVFKTVLVLVAEIPTDFDAQVGSTNFAPTKTILCFFANFGAFLFPSQTKDTPPLQPPPSLQHTH